MQRIAGFFLNYSIELRVQFGMGLTGSLWRRTHINMHYIKLKGLDILVLHVKLKITCYSSTSSVI
jgi:hypothetical protein